MFYHRRAIVATRIRTLYPRESFLSSLLLFSYHFLFSLSLHSLKKGIERKRSFQIVVYTAIRYLIFFVLFNSVRPFFARNRVRRCRIRIENNVKFRRRLTKRISFVVSLSGNEQNFDALVREKMVRCESKTPFRWSLLSWTNTFPIDYFTVFIVYVRNRVSVVCNVSKGSQFYRVDSTFFFFSFFFLILTRRLSRLRVCT